MYVHMLFDMDGLRG